VSTQQERAAERHREKLAAIEQQIANGTLIVRQMTPEERAKNPPRPARGERDKRPRR
jgi:hypothetical protein